LAQEFWMELKGFVIYLKRCECINVYIVKNIFAYNLFQYEFFITSCATCHQKVYFFMKNNHMGLLV